MPSTMPGRLNWRCLAPSDGRADQLQAVQRRRRGVDHCRGRCRRGQTRHSRCTPTTARTNVAFRVLGYIEIRRGDGWWASSASLVRVATQEMPMSGDIVQRVSSSDGAYATGTSSIPNDDTIRRAERERSS